MSQLFGFLVGVSKYHPSSGVTSLSGCVNDVNNMEAFLLKRFQPTQLRIKKLLNEQATRRAVTDTFISHLISNEQIKEDDIVLFYYSGHGSYAASHPAFAKLESEAQDETLVLYDSRCEGSFDLADKELRLLLSRIPPGTNIVVLLDSCHSGSATRNVDDLDAIVLGKSKHAPRRAKDVPRQLSEYLTINGWGYEQLQDAEGNISLPEAKYLALAACDRHEVAYESNTSPEGMFTGMLVRALETGDMNLTYSKLYEYLYTLLKRRARQQTPQLEVYNGYNPDLVFLGNDIYKGKAEYLVVREATGFCTINCGALHGLRNNHSSVQAISVKIYDKDKPTDPPSLAAISAVGLDVSELSIQKLTTKIYTASVVNLPPATCIMISGTNEQKSRWKEIAETTPIEAIAFTYDLSAQTYDYILNINPDSITLTKKDDETLVHGIKNNAAESMKYMLACCQQVCNWHLLLDMQNNAMDEENYEQVFKTKFGIELLVGLDEEWQLQQAEDLVLYLKDSTEKIPFRLRLDTTSTVGWYCAVFYMSSRFGIKKMTSPVDESRLKKDQQLDILSSVRNFSIKKDVDEVIDRFKLIISSVPFKDHLIPNLSDLVPEIVEDRSKGLKKRDIDDYPIDHTWFAKTITVKLVKQSGKIDAARSYTNGKLTIHPHASLSATASTSAIASGFKSAHPSLQLKDLMEMYGNSLVEIDQKKKTVEPPSNVVWLDGLEGFGNLGEDPLRISLYEHPADDEELIALTMKDGIIQLVGTGLADKENDLYNFEINILPEDESRKKSLVRAAWFCFVKVVLRRNPSMLRSVEYENGKVDYSRLDLQNKVQNSTSVALLVHGIIGNTKGMAECMEFLLKEGYYDCILAFDYENLNTKIEDIAATLHSFLKEAGIGLTKPIDIFSHSMGGLVSRYMIEHIPEAHTWVNNLYMFGTPNAGTVFGKLPKLRDWTVGLLTVACNYGGAWLGSIGPVLEVANKLLAGTAVATNTLAQMAADSDFYKLLNNPEWTIKTKYHIIAGNVLQFKPGDDDGRFNRLMEKIKKQLGEWAYSTTENDIAVAVKSILSAPPSNIKTKKEIACHHLNYFELDASVNYFKELIATNNGH